MARGDVGIAGHPMMKRTLNPLYPLGPTYPSTSTLAQGDVGSMSSIWVLLINQGRDNHDRSPRKALWTISVILPLSGETSETTRQRR